MGDPDRRRRCNARHGQRVHLRCHGEVTDLTVHAEEHWAFDGPGVIVRWPELTATYPTAADSIRAVRGSVRQSQVGGEHYRKHEIQVWDVVDEYDLSFYAGNVLKYLLRDKGSRVEDLKKARHFLDKLIEVEEARDGQG